MPLDEPDVWQGYDPETRTCNGKVVPLTCPLMTHPYAHVYQALRSLDDDLRTGLVGMDELDDWWYGLIIEYRRLDHGRS